MSDSPSLAEVSTSQTFLWVAAVRAFFIGQGTVAGFSTSFSDSSSASAVHFVPIADAFPDGSFGGGASLVPPAVVWAKQALVLCPFLPHRRQSASSLRCLVNSLSRTPLTASAKDSHRISWSGYLSLTAGPVPPVTFAGVFSFPWPCRPSVLFCPSEPHPFPSLSVAGS